MSASEPNSAIYVTDSSKEIKAKVCLELFFHLKDITQHSHVIVTSFKLW